MSTPDYPPEFLQDMTESLIALRRLRERVADLQDETDPAPLNLLLLAIHIDLAIQTAESLHKEVVLTRAMTHQAKGSPGAH